MFTRLTSVSLVTTLFWLASSAAFAQAPSKAEVEEYLGKIAKSHGRLNEAGRGFGGLLAPAVKGAAKDKLELYRAYRKMSQLLWKIELETKDFGPPDHPAAKEVKAANDRFIEYQREVVLDKIPGLLEIVDDGDLDEQEKHEKILAQITKDNDREKDLGAKLRDKMAALREIAE